MRPSVQVGDPFEEKKLIEACLELLDAGLARGVQDLGAAGLSCAASETAAAGGTGMDVDVARVHRRETGMAPSEVLISETQERMLAIVAPENLDAVLEVCERWEVRASVVGRVTTPAASGSTTACSTRSASRARTRLRPPATRRPGCPRPPTAGRRSGREPRGGAVYNRPMERPADLDALNADDPAVPLGERFPDGTDSSGELLALLSAPNVAEKEWVWRQYDHQLFLNTVVGPGADATVLRVPGTRGPGDRPRHRRPRPLLRPRSPDGGRLTVMEAARNVACSGAEPRALVNCLNLGNPEHPEVMWQLSEVVRRHRRGLRGARHTRGGREREPLQRVGGRRHRPDARGRGARA